MSPAATHIIAWPAISVYRIQLNFFEQTIELPATAEQALVAGYAIFVISLMLDFRIILQQFQANPG